MSDPHVGKLNEDALEFESRLFGWEMDGEAEDQAELRGKVARILTAPNTRQGAEDAIMAAVADVNERAFRRTARLATLVMLHVQSTGHDAGKLFDALDKMDDALEAPPPP
jgi:transcriptional/translational regulatory protein YebC/TACO1